MYLSEEGDNYEFTIKEQFSGNLVGWHSEEVELPDGYKSEEIEPLEKNNVSESYGERIIYPGTSKEQESPFFLSGVAYKGLAGEIQAAKIYNDVNGLIESKGVSIYEFVEWYQQAETGSKEVLLRFGPENVFGVQDSAIQDSLSDYLDHHEFDGAVLKTSVRNEVHGEVNTEGAVDSILRQAGIQSVKGLLTKNPDEVKRMSDDE